ESALMQPNAPPLPPPPGATAGKPGAPPPPPAGKAPPAPAARPGGAPPPPTGRLAQPKVPSTFNVASALSAVDEAHERWLIQKDKLDFGPFKLAEVRRQIEQGQIKGEHIIVDMENGDRRRVREHPMLKELIEVADAKGEA